MELRRRPAAPTPAAACGLIAPAPQVIPASCLRGSGLLLTPEFRDAVVPETGTYTLQVQPGMVLCRLGAAAAAGAACVRAHAWATGPRCRHYLGASPPCCTSIPAPVQNAEGKQTTCTITRKAQVCLAGCCWWAEQHHAQACARLEERCRQLRPRPCPALWNPACTSIRCSAGRARAVRHPRRLAPVCARQRHPGALMWGSTFFSRGSRALFDSGWNFRCVAAQEPGSGPPSCSPSQQLIQLQQGPPPWLHLARGRPASCSGRH